MAGSLGPVGGASDLSHTRNEGPARIALHRQRRVDSRPSTRARSPHHTLPPLPPAPHLGLRSWAATTWAPGYRSSPSHQPA